MVSSMISFKTALISTGIVTMSLLLNSSVPIAVDFYVSRFPILWSSCLSWLKPPYLFIVVNVIITVIIASSKYYQKNTEDQDGTEEDEILHGGEYAVITQAPPRQFEVKCVDLDSDFDSVAIIPSSILVEEVERSEVVFEEKKEETSGLISGGDEFLMLRSEGNQEPSMIESEKLPLPEQPLVSDRSGHRKKPVKASSKGCKKKALRVVKPKQQPETLENAWMMITEKGKSTPLTMHYRRPSTSGLGVPGDVKLKRALRKAETFRDVTNYRQSSLTVTPAPVKMKMEMSPSREELNRRVEAFIKKCKEERLESLRFEKEVA